MTEFLAVNGVGSKTAVQYGEAFIDCIRKWKVAENVWWGFREDEWKAWLEEERMDRLKQKAMNIMHVRFAACISQKGEGADIDAGQK